MNWYKESQIDQNGEKIQLSNIYDEYEFNDPSEYLSEFTEQEDYNKQYTVKLMSPGELKQLKTPVGESTIYETYLDFASPEQKNLVQDKIRHWDNNRVIVIANRTLLDGHHQAVAAILSNRPQKYIDIYEE